MAEQTDYAGRHRVVSEPATATPLTLELDDYEAANLLHALATHPCLSSGDWYLQIRHKLDRWTLATPPNSLYCKRPGGSHAD